MVKVVPYDEKWRQQFEEIRNVLSKQLGPLALTIEHVGSTSVPGLAAKPILDIDIVISSRDDLGEAVKSVNTQLEFLTKEMQGVENFEKETNDALNRAMKSLTDMRTKQFAQLQGAAAQAQADLSKAKKYEKKEKRAA